MLICGRKLKSTLRSGSFVGRSKTRVAAMMSMTPETKNTASSPKARTRIGARRAVPKTVPMFEARLTSEAADASCSRDATWGRTADSLGPETWPRRFTANSRNSNELEVGAEHEGHDEAQNGLQVVDEGERDPFG